MKHLILGAGVIGQATGAFLEAHKQDVSYYDISKETIQKLIKKNKKCIDKITEDYTLYWICTAEWNVEDVIKKLKNDSYVIIRSTIQPDVIKYITETYGFKCIAHVPEFLREKTALSDIFENDRVIIGTNSHTMITLLNLLYSITSYKILFCTPEESSIIKLTANAWLASQISFWNEIKDLCDKLEIDPQSVSDKVTLDKRISKYGSNMLGLPFGQFCLPKDTKTLQEIFKKHNVKSFMMDAIINTNEKR